MAKRFSICIPTIGRKSIFSTLDSVCNLLSNEVEINLFLNGVDKTEIMKHIESAHSTVEIRIDFTQHQIPMWESIQRALSMGTGDYIWLLGDDDVVLATANEAIGSLSNFSIDPDLIIWNGLEIDMKGNSSQLTTILPRAKKLFTPNAFLGHVYNEMSYLNNGRFAVSKVVRDLMLQHNSGFQGTFHDEYGSLINAITELLNNKTFVSVIRPTTPAVGLGLVTKSWSNHHAQAILGEIVMLSRLPVLTEPNKQLIIEKNLRRISRMTFLIILRFINREKIVFPEDLKFDQVLFRNVAVVNKIPKITTRYLGPILNRIYNSTLRIKTIHLYKKVLKLSRPKY